LTEQVVYRNPNKARIFFFRRLYSLPAARAKINELVLRFGGDPQDIREIPCPGRIKTAWVFVFPFVGGTRAFLQAAKADGQPNVELNGG